MLTGLVASATAWAAPASITRGFDPQLSIEVAAPHKAGNIVLNVELDGVRRQLALQPNHELEQQAARWRPASKWTGHWLYQGSIPGMPDSWVRLSRIDGHFSGAIWDGRNMWNLAAAFELPALARAEGIPIDGHVAYRGTEAWRTIELGDDARALPRDAGLAWRASTKAAGAKGGAFTYNLGLSIVLDTEFQSRFGDESARAVAIVNIVDGYYERTTDTSVYLNELQLLPAGNAGMVGQSKEVLLDQLEDYVPTPSAPAFHAATHLLSGKDAVTGGYAYVGSICIPGFGIGVSAGKHDQATTAALLAHELGHNYGADHDGQPGNGQACPVSGFVMQPTVIIGNPPDDFSTCSIATFAQIASSGTTCLSDPIGEPPLFEDGFES